jgi:hypothetical protein
MLPQQKSVRVFAHCDAGLDNMSLQGENNEGNCVHIRDDDATLPPSLAAALKVIKVTADDRYRCFFLPAYSLRISLRPCHG